MRGIFGGNMKRISNDGMCEIGDGRKKSFAPNCDKETQPVEWDKRSLTIEKEEWLTSQEAADFLKISLQSLFNRVSMGQIPYYKFGRSNRYRLSDLKKLLLGHPRGGF